MLHDDVITEIFNGQNKHQTGSHRKGLSINIKATNRWITTHIYAKLQVELAKKTKMNTSSVHTESTPSGICLHLAHVKSLNQMKGYGYIPLEKDQQETQQQARR